MPVRRAWVRTRKGASAKKTRSVFSERARRAERGEAGKDCEAIFGHPTAPTILIDAHGSNPRRAPVDLRVSIPN